MPDLATLALFAVACLALTTSPGPDMLLIASRSAGEGRLSGWATLAGIQAGTYCHALAAAFGLSQLFLAVPLAYDAVRYAGAAYLLFLAWKAFRGQATALAPPGEARRYPIAQVFRQGLVTNLLNPKMALFVLALFRSSCFPKQAPSRCRSCCSPPCSTPLGSSSMAPSSWWRAASAAHSPVTMASAVPRNICSARCSPVSPSSSPSIGAVDAGCYLSSQKVSKRTQS